MSMKIVLLKSILKVDLNPDSPIIPVMHAILEDFADKVRKDGKIPFIILIEDQGYKDHLSKILSPTLDKHKIPYLSTHAIASPDNLNNFLLCIANLMQAKLS